MPTVPEAWHRELLEAGVREIRVTSKMMRRMLAASLESLHGFHADPADQLVTATAMMAKRPAGRFRRRGS